MKLIKVGNKYINPARVDYLWLEKSFSSYGILNGWTLKVNDFAVDTFDIDEFHDAEKYLDNLAAQIEAALNE